MSFLSFAQENGLLIRSLVYGKISRCPTESHPHKLNGAFLCEEGFGWVQDWGTHPEPIYWKDEKERSQEEIEKLKLRIEASKRKHAQERAEGQQKAANKAMWILGQCELDRHSYFDSKGFPDLLGNVWRKEGEDPILVIPMFFNGDICGCQLIDISGKKKFLTGQRTNNAVFTFDGKGRVFLCEGYATGMSLQAALNALKIKYTIHVCFSAGNVLKMAKTHPEAVIIADHDASGTGQRVAEASGCAWWMPPAEGDDFNDMHKRVGTFAASMIIKKELHKMKK